MAAIGRMFNFTFEHVGRVDVVAADGLDHRFRRGPDRFLDVLLDDALGPLESELDKSRLHAR